jgi:hypothetical protein
MAHGRHGVEPGQKFRPIAHPERLWEVECIITGPADIPHAILRDVGEPSEHRTISCLVLTDRHHYSRADGTRH